MKLTFTEFPRSPVYNNSAGRFLSLVTMYQSNTNYFDKAVTFYEPSDEKGFRENAFYDFTRLVSSTFEELVTDVKTADNIPEATRAEIMSGIRSLYSLVYPEHPNAKVRDLQQHEVAAIRFAGSLLEAEQEITESDEQQIRDSIEELRQLVQSSEISKSARVAILELIRLTRNALDQYTIHGARGFKKALKMMLAELMEVHFHEGTETANQTWWKRAVRHVRLFDDVTSRLLKYKPLLESATTLLLGDS